MSRVTESIIVEFSGTPGVGKSYIADRLLAALRREGFDAHDGLGPVAATLPSRTRAVRKMRTATREAIHAPMTAARIVMAVHRSGQPPKDLVKLVQNWLVVRGLMRGARRFGGIHLFDQGMVQQLCSVGFRGDWRPCLDEAMPGRRHFGPDVIIRVTAPTATNADRLRTRVSHHSRVESLDHDERTAELVRQDEALTIIEAAWAARATATMPVRQLAVTNEGELTDDTLAQLIRDLR